MQNEDIEVLIYQATKNPSSGVRNKAAFKLGRFYEQSNPEECFKWTLKAAEEGHIDAKLLVALSYREGKGVEANNAESAHWYTEYIKSEKILCDNGYDMSMNIQIAWLNDIRRMLIVAPTACDNLSLKWYPNEVKVQYFQLMKICAESNITEAMVWLGGRYYFEGIGTDCDFEKAYSWMNNALEDPSEKPDWFNERYQKLKNYFDTIKEKEMTYKQICSEIEFLKKFVNGKNAFARMLMQPYLNGILKHEEEWSIWAEHDSDNKRLKRVLEQILEHKAKLLFLESN